MDYIDEYDDTRPRYQFRGGGGRVSSSDTSSESLAVSKSHLAICFSASLLLSICAFYAFQHSYDILFSLLLWFSLSLLLAPFAPVSATGGSVYVGGGPALPEPVPSVSNADSSDSSINNNRRSRSRRQVERSSGESEMVTVRSSHDESLEKKKSEQKALEEKRRGEEERREKEEENDWTREDLDLLKKQMTKYSVAGDPNRWEKVASAFKGRHGLESVIRTAKSMQEIKARGEDPFEQFLKKRKPVDPRAVAASEVEAKADLKEVWSSGDDLALLNALKAFPKDVPMRWEKIAAAVPGKSKAGCMKRVSELKKDFRSMKAS